MPRYGRWLHRTMRRAWVIAIALYLGSGVSHAQKKTPASKPVAKKKAPASKPQPASQPSAKKPGATKGRAGATSDALRRAAGAHGAKKKLKKRKLDPYDPRLDSTGTPALPPRENRLPPPSAKPGKERPMPDYRGRASEGATAGKVLIWIPRVILFPVHLTLEYLVRKPIVWTFTRFEEHFVFNRIQRLFSFRGGKTTIFPTAFIDFGLNPTFGFLNTNSDVFWKGHSLTLQGGFWKGWINLQATSTIPVFRNNTGTLTLRGQFFTRPDQVFNGVGPLTRFEDETFYRNRTGEVEALLRSSLGGLNRVNLNVVYRDSKLSGGFGPSIETLWDVRDDTVVPGFRHYQLLRFGTRFELDSRSPDVVFTPGSGVRFEGFVNFNFDPTDVDLNFFRWGGELAGFWDITGRNHVLALRVYTEFVETTGPKSVPIAELIELGGPEYMRGFLLGRIRGQSAFVATFSYQYPIWTFLDANLFAGIGNGFDGRLQNFHIKRMFFNFGVGLRSNFTRAAALELAIAFGSNRFDSDNFEIKQLRFVFGVNQGF